MQVALIAAYQDAHYISQMIRNIRFAVLRPVWIRSAQTQKIYQGLGKATIRHEAILQTQGGMVIHSCETRNPANRMHGLRRPTLYRESEVEKSALSVGRDWHVSARDGLATVPIESSGRIKVKSSDPKGPRYALAREYEYVAFYS